MKIKTKEKDVPIVEVNLELTKGDIKQLSKMDPVLERDGNPYYEDYTYSLDIDIENKEQAELIEKFIDLIDDMERFICK